MSVSRRVTFAGQQFWLVADESFDDHELLLARLEQCDRFGVPDVSTPPDQTFAAVVGDDIYREGVRIGKRSDLV